MAPLSNSDLAELAETHLYYEVAMLRGAVAEHAKRRNEYSGLMTLDRSDPKRLATMAYFEIVLMHSRVLNDFLTVTPSSGSDDVWAGHYVANWQAPSPAPLDRVAHVTPGRTVKQSINKQLAHFSDERLRQRTFQIATTAQEVLDDIATFATHPSNVCFAELKGVRSLLARTLWPTE
jgi:hypothetical protein